MFSLSSSRRLVTVVLAGVLALSACGEDEAATDADEFDAEFDDFDDEFDDDFDDEFDDDFDDEFDDGDVDEFDDEDEEFDDVDTDDTDSETDEASGAVDGDTADLLAELESNGFCDPADIENDGSVTSMHFVVQGDLQPACYTDAGGDDPRLIQAWDTLTAVTPRELYSDVSLLGGYESCDGCDTLAFVTTLDEASSFFLMAVDVAAGESDPEELRLTMLHELTHVFAQRPSDQLDVTITDPGSCETYFNGNGCFRQGAYILDWIDEFWSEDLLADLPADGSPFDDDTAFDVCDANGGFTGSYAATHPEEDFAESFSAYVFDVDVPADLDAKMAFFDRYPEFQEIRSSAIGEGFGGVTGSFDYCR